MNTKILGDMGENLAAAHLERKGYAIIERKFKTRIGEIDLIARQNHVIVFIEVKTRQSSEFGRPGEAVGYRKQQKIIRTASWYIRQKHLEDVSCRFDVIEVYCWQGGYHINQIENAFEVC